MKACTDRMGLASRTRALCAAHSLAPDNVQAKNIVVGFLPIDHPGDRRTPAALARRLEAALRDPESAVRTFHPAVQPGGDASGAGADGPVNASSSSRALVPLAHRRCGAEPDSLWRAPRASGGSGSVRGYRL